MHARVRLRALAGTLAGALVVAGLAACGGGSSDSSGGGGGGAASASCPMSALDKATKPVEITMWHAMTRANEEELTRLADQFNSSQGDVRVKLVNQTGYKESLQKFRAGLSSGDLPQLVQIEDTATQQMIDTQAVVPAQACADSDGYDLSALVPRVRQYYSVDERLWPMPFNVSNPVLLYDRNGFQRAGLDPDKPPSTLAEVTAASRLLKERAGYKYGYGLKLDPWYLEQWSAKAGKTYVNNENGRAKRATAVTFDNPTGLEIFSWMKQMVADGLAATNSAEGQNQYDNLFGIRGGNVGMTVDSSATLGTIKQILENGEGGGVDLGVGPMPGPVGKGGVLVGGAALYIVKKGSSPAQQAAAWKFAKFLNTPENQAAWSLATGYIPTVTAAAEQPSLQAFWQQNPEFKVAYDQLATGVTNVATAGPVIGAYQAVRDAVLAAEQRMFTQGQGAQAALTQAAKEADSAITEYNGRVAG